MTLPAPLAALGAYAQFCTYELIERENGKTDKIPRHVTGSGAASSTDPSTWGTYEQAALAAPGRVGFVFTDQDPFWFLDIDGAWDGTSWSPLAMELMGMLRGCAVEVSQSQRGLHLFGRGVVPAHRCKNIPLHLELYTTKRFAALTMRCSEGGDAGIDLTAGISAVVEKFFAPLAGGERLDDWTNEPSPDWRGPTDDDALILRALKTKGGPDAAFGNGVTFKDLWTCDDAKLAKRFPPTKDSDPFDRSSADSALAWHLSYWTGKDCERIDRLMRRSGLNRDKYDSNYYMNLTITKAAGGNGRVCQDPPPPPPIAAPVGNAPARTLSLTPEEGQDKGNHLAVEYWTRAAGYSVAYNDFTNVVELNGAPLTDNHERAAWLAVRERSAGVKFAKDLFGDVLRAMAWQNRYHPVAEYLDTMQPTWDGMARIDTWLSDYLGVARSPFTDAAGALFLTAGARRIRQPGAKFDEILVLEGPQGTEKSTALLALCPDDRWFSDDIHVGMSSKELLENTLGKWVVEAPELSKLSDAAVEHVKAMLSRQYDRARMAYDRSTTERGRQFITFATTNTGKYLKDPTGNRRFWPALTTRINIAGLTAVRDQLWAEAATREAAGASIRLDRALWNDAAEAQSERVLVDPYQEKLAQLLGDMTGWIHINDVFDVLGILMHMRPRSNVAIGNAMATLGWSNSRPMINGVRLRRYEKGDINRRIVATGGSLIYENVTLIAVK